MFNVGESPVPAPNGMVCSVGFSLFDHTYYVLEGHVHSSGAVLDWITDNLRLVDSTEDTQSLALSVPDNGGVYFVPAFGGLGSPWWVPDAKAMICGLTMQATKAHVVRAALESIAYQVADVVELAKRDIKTQLMELSIDGESAKNDFLMQFQADILGIPVKRLGLEEASGLGSAILNCCACGIFTSIEQIKEVRKISEICLPAMKEEDRIRNRQGWLQSVHTVMLSAKH
jgi:glycerol kinase